MASLGTECGRWWARVSRASVPRKRRIDGQGSYMGMYRVFPGSGPGLASKLASPCGPPQLAVLLKGVLRHFRQNVIKTGVILTILDQKPRLCADPRPGFGTEIHGLGSESRVKIGGFHRGF